MGLQWSRPLKVTCRFELESLGALLRYLGTVPYRPLQLRLVSQVWREEQLPLVHAYETYIVHITYTHLASSTSFSWPPTTPTSIKQNCMSDSL